MYDNESIDTGYSGSIVIPKEIRDMKSVILNLGGVKLDAKQLITSVLAAVLFFVGFKLGGFLFNNEMAFVMAFFLAIPAILFGFVRINKLDFEDWLIVWYSNKHMSTAVRKNNSLNEFEKLEDLYDTSASKKKIKKKKNKSKNKYKAFN